VCERPIFASATAAVAGARAVQQSTDDSYPSGDIGGYSTSDRLDVITIAGPMPGRMEASSSARSNPFPSGS
jgi:hypothetical protein